MVRRKGDEADVVRDRRKHPPVIVSGTRILEAVIIAAVSTALIHLYSLPRIEERLQSIEKTVERDRDDIRRELNSVKETQNELRHDLYAPRAMNNKLTSFEEVR